MEYKAAKTLLRLKPRFEDLLKGLSADKRERFWSRLDTHFERAFSLLLELYGNYYSFFFHLEEILKAVTNCYLERSEDLHDLDNQREIDPLWYQSEKMVAGVCYVDRFAKDLKGTKDKIDYFKELGLTYLHLMPLYSAPKINDGGYAVSSYREINSKVGTLQDLKEFAFELRQNDISLSLDFVFNHTSDEHTWAKKALEGDRDFQEYYLMFQDRWLPDQYEGKLREIFPEQAPGSFTYRQEINRWVWTTFNPYQWDLNYANPAVFSAMLSEMLFLANIGVEVLRLDAVPFVWKQMGTTCENLPQAHIIIQAFNALVDIAAPAMEFKSEAIVHPDFVVKYFGEGEMEGKECTLSYNPTLMALLWESLATREVRLLKYSMQRRLRIPENCTWLNYVRVHDDIGWSFADEDANALWMNPFDHRQFLNRFFTGEFQGSYSSGLLFNYNPITKDGRINGTCASLAGLENAINQKDETAIDFAIKRILLIHSVILSIGGIPLIYLGDEIGSLNDYSYRENSGESGDSRWAHRPITSWEKMDMRHQEQTIEGRIFSSLKHLIDIRKNNPIFRGNKTQVIDTDHPSIFGYIHWINDGGLLVLASFSDQSVEMDLNRFHTFGFKSILFDLVEEREINSSKPCLLNPYQFLWLVQKQG